NKINQSFDDISIEVSAVFKKASCEALLTESINRKGYSRKNYIEKFINEYESDTLKIIKEFINKMSRYEIELKGYQDHQTLTKRVLTENWFSVSYNMTYQNDTFDLMSDGKKAFVILKLLLEVSDKKSPILIDQPEDSLDNRAIYNELVQYIKKKKKERQIILVTHNANVVVNADAEEVIVANQHGEDSKNTNDIKFEYVSGSLENTFPKNKSIPTILHSQGIREHVCEILEGGTEAFKRREDKYGIK
ncbi:MAG: ATP-binding protein, partial [Xanthomonadales bacterium]|nr:ATP-binding protein [Xanthomonadales bacterium]